MRMRKVLLKQSSDHDCGVSALRMLLAYVHDNLTYLTAALPGNLDNFLAIQKSAGHHGVTLKGYEISSEEGVKGLHGPFILQLKGSGQPHFVLAEIKRNKVYVNDPAGEYYVLPRKEVHTDLFSNVLCVEEVKKTEPPSKVSFKSKKSLLWLQALFLFFLGLGFFFMGNVKFDLVSYLALTCAAVTKIGEKHLLLRSVTRFDYAYLKPKVRSETKDFKSKFRKLHAAKVVLLSEPIEVFNSLTSVLFISVILGINNYFLLILCVFLIVISFLFVRAFTTKGSREWRLRELEGELYRVPLIKREFIFDQIVMTTSNLAKKQVYQTIIIQFSLGVIIFLLMYFSFTYSLNFFLFYYFALSYYYFELTKLFTRVLRREEYYQAINTIVH